MREVRPMLGKAMGWLLAAVCAGPACATTGMGEEPDMSMATGDGGMGDAGTEPMGCFMGNPQTEPELLNRCTDAEKVERPGRVPAGQWDGKGPLPLPPI
jgi:hypothetical protein